MYRRPLLFLPLVALACAGCEVTPASHGLPPSVAPDPYAAASPFDRNRVDFGVEEASRGRPTGIIGIYGEAISHSAETSGFGDGASNITQLTFARDGADFDPDVNAQGTHIAFASTQHRKTADLYVKPIRGAAITQLTRDPADDMMPDFSPDGQWIAFTSNRLGNWDIYIMPASGGQPRLVTGDPTHEIAPSWSANGRQLVYCTFGEQSRRWELWAVAIDQTSVRHFLDYGFLPEWSPDPAVNKILFQRARERGSRFHSVWTIDYSDGQGRNPTEIVSAGNAAIINPSWAPDGRHIVFATVLDPSAGATEKLTHSDLWITDLNGTGRTNLTNGAEANFQPCWGRDGRVYFVSNRSGTDNLWSVAARWISGPTAPSEGDAIVNVPESNASSRIE